MSNKLTCIGCQHTHPQTLTQDKSHYLPKTSFAAVKDQNSCCTVQCTSHSAAVLLVETDAEELSLPRASHRFLNVMSFTYSCGMLTSSSSSTKYTHYAKPYIPLQSVHK